MANTSVEKATRHKILILSWGFHFELFLNSSRWPKHRLRRQHGIYKQNPDTEFKFLIVSCFLILTDGQHICWEDNTAQHPDTEMSFFNFELFLNSNRWPKHVLRRQHGIYKQNPATELKFFNFELFFNSNRWPVVKAASHNILILSWSFRFWAVS